MIVELQWSPPDAPCCVKLAPVSRKAYREWDSWGRVWIELDPSVLFQTDWDWPSLASQIGWRIPCRCGRSDGTVDCVACKVTAHEMIQAAGAFLRKESGRRFRVLTGRSRNGPLDDYFT